MTATSHLLASGPGWSVQDIICTAGPRDRAFEERHAHCCIAAVIGGSFQYRSTRGTALLAPGALLLGERGACFEYGHEHATGDRCIAFQFEPAYLETITSGVRGVRQIGFSRSHLPPSPGFAGLIAEMASGIGDASRYEELAIRLAATVTATLVDERPETASPTARDARRITEAVRHIEARSDQAPTLSGLAREVAMSPYHFLRTFRALIGMTPHQFLLHTRLHRAAILLRQADLPVAHVAFDCGFGDLSTFNRRFRRVMGASPTAYRAGGRHSSPSRHALAQR